MKIRDIASGPALTVTRNESPADVERIMATAGIRHLPVLEDGRLVGLWTATETGPVVLLGRDAAAEVTPDADAVEAVEALLGGKEAVLSVEAGAAPGIITRTDVLSLARSGIDRGRGRIERRPLIVRLTGSAGSGKTTLMLRTIPLLTHDRTGIVQANPTPPGGSPPPRLENVPVVETPRAHWRKGFQECIRGLGGLQIVMFEDRDGPLEGARGLGEDLLVSVVRAGDVHALQPQELREVQCVVVTHLDAAPAGFDLEAARQQLRASNPSLEVFGLSADPDDPGLAEWRDWLEARSRTHQS